MSANVGDPRGSHTIVRMRLARLQAAARRRGFTLVIYDSLLEHLAAEGDRADFGPVEIRRLVCLLFEAPLARARRSGAIRPGDRIDCAYDAAGDRVVIETAGHGRRAAGTIEAQHAAAFALGEPRTAAREARPFGRAG
jgi:hypothetical protein